MKWIRGGHGILLTCTCQLVFSSSFSRSPSWVGARIPPQQGICLAIRHEWQSAEREYHLLYGLVALKIEIHYSCGCPLSWDESEFAIQDRAFCRGNTSKDDETLFVSQYKRQSKIARQIETTPKNSYSSASVSHNRTLQKYAATRSCYQFGGFTHLDKSAGICPFRHLFSIQWSGDLCTNARE